MESVEERLAKLEAKQENHAEKIDNHNTTLYGENNEGGLIREFRDLKTENKYLRYIYILATALVLPWVNAALGKMGMGPIKLG